MVENLTELKIGELQQTISFRDWRRRRRKIEGGG
jgi:hypothetical protein